MRLRVIALAVLLSACPDECEKVPPSMQIDVSVQMPEGVVQMDVELEIDGDTFFRSFPIGDELDDGRTSLAIDLGEMRVTKDFTGSITVELVDADGTPLYRTAGLIRGTPDGCNQVLLGPSAVDAGMDDAGTDDAGVGCGDCGGANPSEQSCLQYGLRPGAGDIECKTDCSGLEPPEMTCLGGEIDSVMAIEGALQDAAARPGTETIAIHSGTYALSAPLVVDAPEGARLSALDGLVELTGAGVRLESANSGVVGIRFSEVTAAIAIAANDCTVVGNEIINATVAVGAAIDVDGAGAIVSGNRIVHSAGQGGVAIDVDGTNNTVRLNVIRGPFDLGIRMGSIDGENPVDHNTVWLDAGRGTAFSAVSTSPADSVCLRNNVFAGNAQSTGLDISNQTRFRGCGGPNTDRNASVGHGTQCTGRCNDCTGGALCTIDFVPAFAAELCPLGDMVDQGVDLGLVTVVGAAPDLGGLEAGRTYRFGGTPITCP